MIHATALDLCLSFMGGSGCVLPLPPPPPSSSSIYTAPITNEF